MLHDSASYKKLAYSNCFVFVDAIDTNSKELELNSSQSFALLRAARPPLRGQLLRLIKMSPPQLYKRGLMLINQLILATERSFGPFGQLDLIDVRLASITIPPQESSPSPFGMSVLACRQKETPPKAGAWDLLIKPGSLGVGSAAIGQS